MRKTTMGPRNKCRPVCRLSYSLPHEIRFLLIQMHWQISIGYSNKQGRLRVSSADRPFLE
jgi:hypothetical protein